MRVLDAGEGLGGPDLHSRRPWTRRGTRIRYSGRTSLLRRRRTPSSGLVAPNPAHFSAFPFNQNISLTEFFLHSFPHFSTPLDSNFVRHTCSMRPASSSSSSLVEVSPEHRLGHRTREAKTRPRPWFENRGKINVLSQLELWYYYNFFSWGSFSR